MVPGTFSSSRGRNMADWNRRHFLKTLGLGVGAACWMPGTGWAKSDLIAKLDEKNWLEPDGLTGEPLGLGPWAYGKQSFSTSTMLMFRGNPTHTFYGTGPVSEKPKQVWSQTLAKFHTLLRGRQVVWTGTGWSGQPAFLGGYVFVGGQGGYFYAFDAKTGEVRWRFKGNRMFKGSCCVYNNRIYTGNTDDFFRCLDANTGKQLWAINTGTDCDSSGVVVDGRLYVAGESGFLRCINPDNGKHHWKTHLGGTGKGTLPGSNGSETSPAVSDGEVYAATYDGFLHCLDVKKGRVKWKVSTGDDTDVSPVIVGDRVYIAAEEKSPYLYCFDRSKKGATVWSMKNTGGWWSTPAVVGDRLYIGGNDGRLYCRDAKSGKSVWTYKADAAIWSSPAVVDGKVIFGTRGTHLHMLDAKTGKHIWKGDMGGRTLSTPIVVDGAIYVGSAYGEFKCFK